jgi:primosomal protein N' (replication factor Y)
MIDRVLKENKTAIVLVPEISLTPQTVRRFRARFGDNLSVLHSRLTDTERFEEWNRINRNEVKIAIGARSALFAPFSNLGVIIVDEEHESSYKQSESPRYVARDVAVMRGQLENCCVILGSATPCAESSFNAQNGKFVLVEMKSQVASKPSPRITILDRRLDPAPTPGENRIFSPVLIEAVRRKVENAEQCILFLNRRGYARNMSCPECGYEACCPDCSVPGTGHSTPFIYSRSKATLSCHLCGRTEPAPEICPDCKSPDIRFSGTGTEKLESVSRGAFPFARVGRMDSDSMRSAEDYERVLEEFRRGELDILIGTQMIAKGLHFPNVTLVGIVNADLGLMIPDFRASEKVFQLITQVAGRAGRGDHPGEVIIQTSNPGNDTIDYAANFDFDGFRDFDLEFRKLLNYPPYSRIILLNFRGESEKAVEDYAKTIHDQLLPYMHDEITMTPPAPAPIERIKGKFRYQILIKGNKLKTLREAIRILVLHRTPPRNVEFYADVDPQSLL